MVFRNISCTKSAYLRAKRPKVQPLKRCTTTGRLMEAGTLLHVTAGMWRLLLSLPHYFKQWTKKKHRTKQDNSLNEMSALADPQRIVGCFCGMTCERLCQGSRGDIVSGYYSDVLNAVGVDSGVRKMVVLADVLLYRNFLPEVFPCSATPTQGTICFQGGLPQWGIAHDGWRAIPLSRFQDHWSLSQLNAPINDVVVGPLLSCSKREDKATRSGTIKKRFPSTSSTRGNNRVVL